MDIPSRGEAVGRDFFLEAKVTQNFHKSLVEKMQKDFVKISDFFQKFSNFQFCFVFFIAQWVLIICQWLDLGL